MKYIPVFFAIVFSLIFNPRSRAGEAWTTPSPGQISSLYPEVEALYLDLHRNPELSLHEQKTAAKLAERAKALGFEVTTGLGGNGLVAVLRNGPGRTVMLRTELDGLPVEEKTGLPFASKATAKNDAGETVPVAQACGHDIHMAAWCGTARIMAENKSRWHGTLILIAQPAEEVLKGAAAMIRDGLFNRFPKPDFVLAIHDSPALPAGQVGYIPGYAKASADNLNITIFGRGGHGAQPWKTVDPIVIAARTVVAWQSIVAREISPQDPAVITVGSIQGGTKNNIIPDEVKLKLTVRSYKPEVRKRLLASIKRVAQGESLAGGAPREPLVEEVEGTNALYNDPEWTLRLASALRKALGDRNVVEIPAEMTSEDFSEFPHAGLPSSQFYVGAVEPGKFAEAKKSGKQLPGLHSSQWAPDRKPTLETAMRVEVTALLEALRK